MSRAARELLWSLHLVERSPLPDWRYDIEHAFRYGQVTEVEYARLVRAITEARIRECECL